MRTSCTFIAYCLLAIGVLGANPFHSQTVGPFDLLMSKPGWSVQGAERHSVRNPYRTDVLDAMLPRWIFARQSLRDGRLPLWNPLPGGGEAGLQNLASAQLSPAFMVFALAPTPASGLYLATLLNLVLAGFGAHVWLRFHVRPMAAAFGGIAFMLCGFHAAWLFWPHMSTSIWVCWLFWAISRWWERPNAARFVPMVIATALLVVGGFPFVTELGLGAAVLYTLLLLWFGGRQHLRHRVAGVAAALVFAMGLCAIPLMAMVRWLGHMDIATRVGGSGLSFWPDASFLLPGGARASQDVESAMYVGTPALMLALTGVALVLLPQVRRRLLGVFGLAILAVGTVLVFELVPYHLLSWVPGLGTNRWSRSIQLLDLALAALSAFALDELAVRLRRPVMVLSMGIVVLAAQVFDQAEFFRSFNGPVPVAWFYPQTPLLARARDGLRPFDSVIADQQYMVSGTLGAYGIPEWFAHGFKSAKTKSLLERVADNPFTTPTASALEGKQLMLANPVLRSLGVRYVLGDESLLQHSLVPAFQDGTQRPMVALPALGTQAWKQRVDIPAPFSLDAVDIRLATYGKSELSGSLEMDIRDADNNDDLVAHASLKASTVIDGGMAHFTISPEAHLPVGSYLLTLRHEGGQQDEPMTAWYTPGEGTNCALVIDVSLPSGCLIMRWISMRHDTADWREIARDQGLLLIEDMHAVGGPYFLPSLDTFPNEYSGAFVELQRGRGTSWTMAYSGHDRGYVVLPMNANTSWRYWVDGDVVSPLLYLGALPAIAVSGPATIRADYRPSSIRNGRWIMLASAVLLATFLVFLRRRFCAIK